MVVKNNIIYYHVSYIHDNLIESHINNFSLITLDIHIINIFKILKEIF
jgi:hypothetical protein